MYIYVYVVMKLHVQTKNKKLKLGVPGREEQQFHGRRFVWILPGSF